MHAAQKPKSKLKFVTLDKESNMSTLRRRDKFLRICSKEELQQGGAGGEGTGYRCDNTSQKKSRRTVHSIQSLFWQIFSSGAGDQMGCNQ
jgi:hypothetical protein